MKALISLALLIGGVYLIASSAADVLTSASQDDTWWYIAWFAGGVLCCFLAIPMGLAAGATGNRYRLQDPRDLAYGSAAHGYDRRDDDDYQRPAVTGHIASQEEREAARSEYQRKVWLEEIAGSEAASGAPEDQSRWWEKPAIRRIDDTQPPEPPKKDGGNLRDLNEDDWRRMGL